MTLTKVLDLYVSPGEFFTSTIKARRHHRIALPFLCVAVVCALSMFNVLTLQKQIITTVAATIQGNPNLPPAARDAIVESIRSGGTLLTVASSFSTFMYVPMWVLLTAILANLAILFNRDYEFMALLEVIGYAFAAYIPVLLFVAVVLLRFKLDIPRGGLYEASSIFQVTDALKDLGGTVKELFPANLVRYLNWFGFAWFYLIVAAGFHTLYRTRVWQTVFCLSVSGAMIYGAFLLLEAIQ